MFRIKAYYGNPPDTYSCDAYGRTINEAVTRAIDCLKLQHATGYVLQEYLHSYGWVVADDDLSDEDTARLDAACA